MTTVGEILKNKRLERKLALSDVEKAIKIRSKFLEALEKNDFPHLPPAPFTRGFIQNYAAFLGLNAEEILAFYRRETNLEKAHVLPDQIGKINRKFSLTPQFFTAAVIGLLIVLFSVYLFSQYLLFSSAPLLNVVNPADYSVVQSSPVEITGSTDPNAFLLINGQIVTLDDKGNFSIKIDLSPGLNTFTIISESKFKKQTQVVRHLRLESP